MLGILFLFLLYAFLIKLLPLIPELFCAFVVLILYPALQFLVKAGFRALIIVGRFSWASLVFFYYLADEALHSKANPEGTDRKCDKNIEFDKEKSYEKALMFLGLQENCTKKECACAFSRAMVRAHPDKGGTNKQAMAINAARRIVKSHKGWR